MRGAALALALALAVLPAGSALAAAAGPLAPPPEAEAVKPGTATWRLLGVIVNQDSGHGHQQSSLSGPHGDTMCVCKHHNGIYCESWQGAGEYRVAWREGRWAGRGSSATFPGSTAKSYGYSASNGLETACNWSLGTDRLVAQARAAAANAGFATLPRGSATANTYVGASVPVANVHVVVPGTYITSSGTGQWMGSDISWSFTYSGNARYTGVTVCQGCLSGVGQSNF